MVLSLLEYLLSRGRAILCHSKPGVHCLGIRPVASVQERPRKPLASTAAPHGQLWGWHRSVPRRSPIAALMASSSIVAVPTKNLAWHAANHRCAELTRLLAWFDQCHWLHNSTQQLCLLEFRARPMFFVS